MKRLILPHSMNGYWRWLRDHYKPAEAVKIHSESVIILDIRALHNYRDIEMWVLPGASLRRDFVDFMSIAQDRGIILIHKSEN